MKAKTLLLLPLIALVACSSNEPSSQNASSKYNILFKVQSPYLQWYLNDMESFISYSIRTFPSDLNDHQYENVRRTEDNTITLENGLKIRLHDDYVLKDEKDSTHLYLKRTATLQEGDIGAPLRMRSEDIISSEISQEYTYQIPIPEPINLYSPEIDYCNLFPLCYYENFILRWNADMNNNAGVVIISEWNGCMLECSPQDISIANVDLVADNGETVLNTDLFQGIPDKALVNLYLIRGNLTTITNDGILTLGEALQLPPEQFEEILQENPDILLELQPFMLGSGAVSTFSFFLIREL